MCAFLGWARTAKGTIRRFLDDVAMRRELREELAGLGPDLDRVLADIGISRGEMEALIENASRSRRLLQAMVRRLDLGGRMAGASPELLRGVERRCATCASQKECSAWIVHGRDGGYQRFCPNAETFGALERSSKAA
jgi:uncharacterized protein YjiS (DUF1127 family)